MFEGLDAIPWENLSHAYGSAADVPTLLRALAAAPSDADGPLWQLFGSIWHQGTVYEATAPAVPFLIALAANPQRPDCPGILLLLAAIAKGSSYRAAHGNILNEPDFEARKARELAWAADAHRAVASGVETYLALTREAGEVRLAAAHVLAQLPEHADIVRPLLHELLGAEAQPLHRAGLLLGQCGDPSHATLPVLLAALDAGESAERRAAAVSIAWLAPRPLPDRAREAILAALMIDDLEASFYGLPWDAQASQDGLIAGLDAAARNEAAARLIAVIEGDGATHMKIGLLLDILFARAERGAPPLRPRDLSPLQKRAVHAMAQTVQGERRIFLGSYPRWGLPKTKSGWADLVAEREPTPVDPGRAG